MDEQKSFLQGLFRPEQNPGVLQNQNRFYWGDPMNDRDLARLTSTHPELQIMMRAYFGGLNEPTFRIRRADNAYN